MRIQTAIRLSVFLAAAVGLTAWPADAQYRPRPLNDPATGESYHIEASAGYWNPTADITVASESLNIPGTLVDFKKDLGLTDRRFPDLQLVLRPATKHKFRFRYTPIKYDSSSTLQRDIVFNGIRYRLGVPVSSLLDWKSYRFGYEYDFISRNRGFAGFITEFKYTDVTVRVTSLAANEFAHVRAPIPTIGFIGRGYVMPNISVTGEITGVKVPDSVSKTYNGQYFDFDLYATVNFTNNVGAHAGYRSLNARYKIDLDTGDLTLKGLYFGLVARF